MPLFLVQHGKSLSKDKDPEQGLSEAGISETKRIATVAQGYGVKVSIILHSGKKRARQTADIMASALKPEQGTREASGLKPLDDVSYIAGHFKNHDNTMLVGHLPHLERLTSYLITGNADKTVIKFQNGGIICLDQFSNDSTWLIKWSLMPNID